MRGESRGHSRTRQRTPSDRRGPGCVVLRGAASAPGPLTNQLPVHSRPRLVVASVTSITSWVSDAHVVPTIGDSTATRHGRGLLVAAITACPTLLRLCH